MDVSCKNINRLYRKKIKGISVANGRRLLDPTTSPVDSSRNATISQKVNNFTQKLLIDNVVAGRYFPVMSHLLIL